MGRASCKREAREGAGVDIMSIKVGEEKGKRNQSSAQYLSVCLNASDGKSNREVLHSRRKESQVGKKGLLVACWHLLLEVPHQRHPQFRLVIPSQRVLYDLGFDGGLDLCTNHEFDVSNSSILNDGGRDEREREKERKAHHLQCPSDHTLQNLRIHQPALDRLLRQFHKLRQRVLVENE